MALLECFWLALHGYPTGECIEKYLQKDPIWRDGPFPGPELDEKKTLAIVDELSIDSSKAAAVSWALDKALAEAKIEFDTNTTYAAMIFAIKKPQFAGQIIAKVGAKQQLAYISDPTTTKFASDMIHRELLRK